MLQGFKQAARPFTIYAAGTALALGVFTDAVTVEKLWVLAAVIGVGGTLRTLDKCKLGPAT